MGLPRTAASPHTRPSYREAGVQPHPAATPGGCLPGARAAGTTAGAAGARRPPRGVHPFVNREACPNEIATAIRPLVLCGNLRQQDLSRVVSSLLPLIDDRYSLLQGECAN